MDSLTESQLAAKARVEARGGTFVPPGQYRKIKKGAVKANPNQIATYSAKKQYKQIYKRISSETEEIIDQVLDPESAAGNAVRWPNTYGKSAIYSVKNILNASFADDNRCAVAVYPRLRNAIFSTAGQGFSANLLEETDPGQKPYVVQAVYLQGSDTKVNLSSPIYFRDHNVVLPTPNETTGKLLYEFTVSESADPADQVVLEFVFPEARLSQVSCTVSRYGDTFGLISTNDFTTDASGKLSCQIYNGVSGFPPVPPSYLSFEFFTNGTPWAGTASGTLYLQPGAATVMQYTLPNSAQHMIAYDIRDADVLIENAERSMVLSQSLLCTAQMSDINNGGAISIARVPGGTNIGESGGNTDSNSWYEWLASLATNNYDGPSKKGAYGFYLPDDERGYFYRDNAVYQALELPYLASEFTVADTTEGSIMRIKVCTIVQFTTNSSTFQLAPSPMCNEIYEVHQLLSLVNACYENDSHRDQLKKILKRVGGQVKKVVKNPKNWEKTASYLAALLI